MFVPVVFATVVPDEDGQRSAYDEGQVPVPSRSQTPPTPPEHCHVDVANYANPINCSSDGPEGGHKTWVHQQGLRTNQGSSSAKTLMTHSLNKEASQLLCHAVPGRGWRGHL